MRIFSDIDVHDGRQLHLREQQIFIRDSAVPVCLFRALSIQITLELPAITVLTKCDLMKDKEKLDQYLNYFSIDNYE